MSRCSGCKIHKYVSTGESELELWMQIYTGRAEYTDC